MSDTTLEAHRTSLSTIYSVAGLCAFYSAVACWATMQGRPIDPTALLFKDPKPERLPIVFGDQAALLGSLVIPTLAMFTNWVAKLWARAGHAHGWPHRLPPIFGLCLDRNRPGSMPIIAGYFTIVTLVPFVVSILALARTLKAKVTREEDGSGVDLGHFTPRWGETVFLGKLEYYPLGETVLVLVLMLGLIWSLMSLYRTMARPRADATA